MEQHIKKELQQLEQQQQIKILYAVESGSRVWGFNSVNSDLDVRFLYVQRPEWYLQIDPQKDSIEALLPGSIDLSGWELRKALRLYRKSNPPMFEWLHSSIVYSEPYTTAARLRALQPLSFSVKAAMHHYLNMALNNYRGYLQQEPVRVKKYLYVLRPLLACEWLYRQGCMPPLLFTELLQAAELPEPVCQRVQLLLQRKIAGEELGQEVPDMVLLHFLEQKLEFFSDCVKQVPAGPETDTGLLNQLFRDTLSEVWG